MNKILFPLTAIALCFTAHQVMAASVSTSGTAKAKIISALTIAADTSSPMNFGTMLGDADHTVVLSTAGARDCGNSGKCVEDSNTPTAGHFTITAPQAQSAHIAIDTSFNIAQVGSVGTVKYKLNNGAETAAVSGSGSEVSLVSGTNNLYVGGTLSVDSSSAQEGEHTGTYNVTVNY